MYTLALGYQDFPVIKTQPVGFVGDGDTADVFSFAKQSMHRLRCITIQRRGGLIQKEDTAFE